MRIAVIGTKTDGETLQNQIGNKAIVPQFFNDIQECTGSFAIIFDFLFQNDPARVELLKSFDSCIFINSVLHPLEDGLQQFIRFNGWQGFLERNLLEIAVSTGSDPVYQKRLQELDIKYIVVPDIIGMVTPRIVSMIINEAYFALGEEVSTKADIDTAMLLGTNYPYGPFAWSEKIGLENVYQLLQKLYIEETRYQPAAALIAAVTPKI